MPDLDRGLPVEPSALTPQAVCLIVYPLDTLCHDGKDVGLRIRVDHALRGEFIEACKAADTPAAQVLRAFMRDYVARRSKEKSAGLWRSSPSRTKKRPA